MKHRCSRGDPSPRFLAKLRKLKKLSESVYPGTNLGTMPSSIVFNHRWPFRYRCGSEEERIFLHRRIRSYLFNGRRGRFRLPSRFRDLEAEVLKMTKSQLREVLFSVRPDRVLDCELSSFTVGLAESVLPNCIWRPPKQSLDALARRVDTPRLAKRDWPRNPRSLWPSFPSISEMAAMSLQGKTCTGLWRPRLTTPNCLSWKHVRDSRTTATRIVRQNIVGIRSTVSVPGQFLPWFRYRYGFLILSVRHRIPIGLVRFLLGQWKTCPYNLWLQVPCRLKYYLRLQDRRPRDAGAFLFPSENSEFQGGRESVGNTKPVNDTASQSPNQ